jgi:hypothetical protein
MIEIYRFMKKRELIRHVGELTDRWHSDRILVGRIPVRNSSNLALDQFDYLIWGQFFISQEVVDQLRRMAAGVNR